MLSPSAGPALAATFGLGHDGRLTGPVARGEQGQVWRLDTERGAFAVKDPFVEMSPAAALADADYQDVVLSAGVPMPEPLRTPDGRVLVEVEGSPARVYRWVDVLDRDRRLDPGEVGRLLAHIHSAVVPTDGPMDAWYVEPIGPDGWREIVERLHAGRAPFAADLEAVLPDVLAVEALLERPPATQMCHLDLWSDNLRRTPEGGLMVLDWENSGPGDPSHELGCVVFEFGVGDPERIRALHEAYVEAGGPGRLERPAHFTVLAAQLGHITEVGCARWLESTTEDERRHNEAWVREFVDDPVTTQKIERILAAVSSPRRS